MTWNWEQPDWPRLAWDARRLAKAEERFVRGGGIFLGTVRHLAESDREQVVVEAMGSEAVTTSEIEGEILDRESVQSSIRQQLGLASDRRRVKPAERGIGEMMVDLYRGYGRPLDEGTLCSWHAMVCRGRTDLREVGRYRTHAEAMRVVSGRIDKPTVHFEAPPSDRVGLEMARFVEWFNRRGPGGAEPLGALTRAGVAHLYFESIHPFEDGNGRIGRAISEKALAQSLGQPALTALAATILTNRREYYDALEAANKQNEITEWLAWFAGVGLEAQERTLAQVEFVIEKTKLLDRAGAWANARQRAVLLRVMREGPEGFTGGLSAKKYVTIAKTSSATATRDLGELVERGILRREGEKKGARYYPMVVARKVARVIVGAGGEVVEL